MDDDEAVTLTGLQPINLPTLLKRGTCRTCVHSAMEGKDRVCRFFPPQVTFMAVPTQQMVATPQGPRQVQAMAVQNFSGFPVVKNEQGCGQFSPKVHDG